MVAKPVLSGINQMQSVAIFDKKNLIPPRSTTVYQPLVIA
jgi:hypothetical protein